MSWSGGVYTKGNAGSGGWAGDAASGIGIEAGRHDTQDNDFATGINQCLNKDGSNAATGNLNLGGNKLTNVAVGTASTDVVTLGQVQAGISTSGTALEITNTRFSNDTVGPYISLQKSRGATVGTNTIVQNGDVVGVVRFNGANGTNFTEGAYLAAFVDGTPGASNDMPTRLVLATTADNAGIATERMRIDSAGNVGIGGTATERLSLIGAAGVSAGISFRGNALSTANEFFLGHSVSANEVYVYNRANTPMQFGTNNTERMRITANGQVLVGTTASGSSTGGCLLRTKVLSGTIWNHGPGTSGGGNTFYVLNDSDVGVQLASGGTSWSAASDQRAKKNIQDLEYGLEELKNLRPVRYNYLVDEIDDGKRMGFIAQEVLPIIPEVIYGTEEETYSLAMTDLIPTLVKGIQQLNDKVEALEARIAALES